MSYWKGLPEEQSLVQVHMKSVNLLFNNHTTSREWWMETPAMLYTLIAKIHINMLESAGSRLVDLLVKLLWYISVSGVALCQILVGVIGVSCVGGALGLLSLTHPTQTALTSAMRLLSYSWEIRWHSVNLALYPGVLCIKSVTCCDACVLPLYWQNTCTTLT